MCYSFIRDHAKIVRGVSYKKEVAKKEPFDGSILLLRANNILNGELNYDDCVYIPRELITPDQIVHEGDIIITMSSGSKAHVGKVAIARSDLDCTIGAFCAKIIPIDVYPKYLFFVFQSQEFRQYIESQCKGTNINNLKQSYIYGYLVNLPSNDKQQRIVARIEELFSQLEDAEATLQKTKAQLAVYSQAVLQSVFTMADDCSKHTIADICDSIVDCPHSTPKWVSKGRLCLRTTNFRRGYLDLSVPNYVSEETFNTRNRRLVPTPGDVLYSREGAILGIACIIPQDTYVCLGQRMMLLRPGNKVMNKYLMYYLNSPEVTAFVASKTGGSASPHVNVGDIKGFRIPIPNLEQQVLMINEIESRLSVCESIEQTVVTTLQQVSAMRQSILKQAFGGPYD